MYSKAFYIILLTSITFAFFGFPSLVYIVTNGQFSFGGIFAFIVVFPLFWNWGKKKFPRDDKKTWNEKRKIFILSSLVINILIGLTFFGAMYVASIKSAPPTPQIDDNAEKTINFGDI